MNELARQINQLANEIHSTNAMVSFSLLFSLFILAISWLGAHRAHKARRASESTLAEIRELKSHLQVTK